MSATNRGAIRNERDNYPTPLLAFEPLIPYIKCTYTDVWEPASGDGRLVEALLNAGVIAKGDDINNGYDYLLDNSARPCVVTNPPYSLAKEFVDHALDHSKYVFMLLRLNFLASTERKEWWKLHEPDALFVLSRRPSFCKFWKCKNCKASGMVLHSMSKALITCGCNDQKLVITTTDATDYAWYFWDMVNPTPIFRGIHHL